VTYARYNSGAGTKLKKLTTILENRTELGLKHSKSALPKILKFLKNLSTSCKQQSSDQQVSSMSLTDTRTGIIKDITWAY